VSAPKAVDATELGRDNENLREQQRAISGLLRTVASGGGLQPVLDEVVKSAARLCDGEYAQLYFAEGDTFHAFSRFVVSDPSSAIAATAEEQWRLDQQPHARDRSSLVGRVAVTGEAVHIPDFLADPDFSFPIAGQSRAGLGVPVVVDGDLIGVIVVVRDVARPFGDDDIELVKTFADQAAIAITNARLMDAVERQRTELSRFVSPQVAQLVSSDEGKRMLSGHRAYISALFCDLRGFTAFAETAAPEELFDILGEYHLAVGHLIPEHEGTLEHFAGDGLFVFFNDPLPVEEHELKAIRFALAAHDRFAGLAEAWRKKGIELGLGIGIASGYATLGRIGFEGRYDYGALGPVTNLASRLSSAATAGQTLIAQRMYAAVEDAVEARELPGLELKGFGRPVVAHEVLGLA
jgi:class 3 adenylate cyclase